MFIRQTFRTKNGQRHAYWALVESYRTASGPRQRVVAWVGKLDDNGRLGVLRAAEEAKQSAAQDTQHGRQQPLNHQLQFEFDDDPTPQPRWVEVNAAGVRVENLRQFGGPWMALHLFHFTSKHFEKTSRQYLRGADRRASLFEQKIVDLYLGLRKDRSARCRNAAALHF